MSNAEVKRRAAVDRDAGEILAEFWDIATIVEPNGTGTLRKYPFPRHDPVSILNSGSVKA